EIIEELTLEIEVGQVFTGTVTRIEKFGAFVQLTPKQNGMVHISELQHKRTNKVEDVVQIGDQVKVKVIEVDNRGRINLSMKALT
ncbi:S1 RNA-binding domain-containing protein, partial [Streptococcus pasteurianus]